MNPKIATVISYCTHDYKWLKPCVEKAKQFSEQVIIPVSDHFFNGAIENRELLDKSYEEVKEVDWLEFEYDPSIYEGMGLQRLNDPFTPTKFMMDIGPREIWFWNQIARLHGFNAINNDIEYVLFLDVDEIVETEKFIPWLDEFPYGNFSAIRFETYFYFRDAKYRAVQTEDWNGITLVKKDKLNDEIFFKHSSERLNFVNFTEGNKLAKTGDKTGTPMIHHYSWVRTKEEMLRKVKSWSHHEDRNWSELVEKEFERDFDVKNDKCFVHDYNYIEVAPYITI